MTRGDRRTRRTVAEWVAHNNLGTDYGAFEDIPPDQKLLQREFDQRVLAAVAKRIGACKPEPPVPASFRPARRFAGHGCPVWEKIDRYEKKGACHIWTGAVDRVGYAKVMDKGKERKVHEEIWKREHGEIPPKHWVKQTCGDRRCIALKHLELVDKMPIKPHVKAKLGAKPDEAEWDWVELKEL